MAVRAVRGAVQLEQDEAGHMDEQVGALLTAVLERNNLVSDDLISIWFTATPDLHSDFPAAAARGLGIVDVPLICAQELDIKGAMPRVVRILAHVETPLPRAGIQHVYLGATATLRKDIAQ
ncbi:MULTISPECIES: chorismate mutase [unclassified Streptomyces]|uniref:chorismate mutase n=1 Tax=unclassified Streptomyces TaxID=2593676 RepID=UPI00093F3D70|nr:chorismate mutase [Streptomyces sp. TSRI0281]OKI31604.1 chorismate mutase [Streptomyces sp. TSRI0281]